MVKKLIVFILIVAFAANFLNKVNSGTNFAGLNTQVFASKSISAKALTDHECNTTEWHFVINQIDSLAVAPSTITVSWGNVSAVIPLDKFTGGTAHYVTTQNLNLQVTSATTSIYGDWGGEFNLSHGPCGNTNPSPTPTPSVSPTGTPTPYVSPTPTPNTDCGQNQTYDPGLHICVECNGGGTCEVNIGGSPTPAPTTEPSVTPTPTVEQPQLGGGSSSNSSSNSSSSSSNSSPASASQNEAFAATNYANTGTFENSAASLLLVIGSIMSLTSLALYGKKRKAVQK
jgi:hypothetical protein